MNGLLHEGVIRFVFAFGLVPWMGGVCFAQGPCPGLEPPSGPIVEVSPDDADDLRDVVAGAAAGTTILLADGIYAMDGGDYSHRLHFTTPGVTLRSASGNRDAVILDGGYVTAELISIQASNTVIADLTVQKAFDHPIHVSGPGTSIEGIVIHNVRIVDPGQQAVKINAVEGGTVNNSVLRCSHIELTNSGRSMIRDNCYTGGLDAHAATGWRIWRNRIEGFWCAEGLSEHGIHLWRQSADTLVEENVVVDCARGIGFGLGPGADGTTGGVIRNNFIAAADPGLFASSDGFDSGIVLWGAEEAEVYHNTIASTQAPRASSIEWRFIDTNVTIANNLMTDRMWDRGGTVVASSNMEYASTDLLIDVAAGKLYLSDPVSSPVGAGTQLAAGVCDRDIDGQLRGTAPDIGADEYGWGIFVDGFESGDDSWWSD